MSEAPVAPIPRFVEHKPLTFADHIANVYHLIIKELRSIRADPVMLFLVIYSFTISVNTVATGAVTEATNLSVGIVDEDGSALSRQIAEALRQPTFQPPVQIRASDIDPMMDKNKLLFVVEIPPNFEADVARPAQNWRADQRRCDRRRPGRQWRELCQNRDRQRDPAIPRQARTTRPQRRSIWSCGPLSTRTSRRHGSRR